MGKDVISLLKDAFPVKFPDIKILPTTETDKRCNTFPEIKKKTRRVKF
jgi:hypothetical protein